MSRPVVRPHPRVTAGWLIITATVLLAACVDTSGLRVGEGGDDPPPADAAMDTSVDAPVMDASNTDTASPPAGDDCARPMLLVGFVDGGGDHALRRFSIDAGTGAATECSPIALGGELEFADVVGMVGDLYVAATGTTVRFIRANGTLRSEYQHTLGFGTAARLMDSATLSLGGEPVIAIGGQSRGDIRRSNTTDLSCIEFFSANGSVKAVGDNRGCTGTLEDLEGWGGVLGFGQSTSNPNGILAVRRYEPARELDASTGAYMDLFEQDFDAENVTITSGRAGGEEVIAWLAGFPSRYIGRSLVRSSGERFTHTCEECDIGNVEVDPSQPGAIFVTCRDGRLLRARTDGVCEEIIAAAPSVRLSDLFLVE